MSLFGIAQSKDVTIGLAVANLQADFFNQIKQSVEAEAKAKGVTVITVDAKGDSATQVSQVQDLITRGVKALIYIPAGATAAGVPVKTAHHRMLPATPLSQPIAYRPRRLWESTSARLPAGRAKLVFCKANWEQPRNKTAIKVSMKP
jgi:ABC-type xylose transport system substrate-binding protein